MGKMGMTPLLLALSVIFILASLSIPAFAAEDINWIEKQSSAKLYWGDSIIIEGYEIRAEDFSENMVFISILKDGKVLKASPLSAGTDIVYDDTIKVYAQDVNQNYETIRKDGKEFRTQNRDPYAELKIFVSGEPELEIKIETKKDVYDPKNTGDSRIEALINVKNKGEAEAEDLILTVDAPGMELFNGKNEYRFSNLRKEETLEPVKLTLKAPAPWKATEYNINAKIICSGVKNKKYEYLGSKTVKIEEKWGLVISKNYQKESHMGKTVHVSVNVRNNGLCDISDIQLKDSIIPGMHSEEESLLEKTLSLKAGEGAERVFDYTLIPENPGEFTFPKTTATFTLPDGQNKQVESDVSEPIKIYGPKITVTKNIDKQQLNPGEELNVVLTAQNSGNVDANVTLSDFILPETKLISGETSFKQVLGKNGESKRISYTLQMNSEGEIQLPACKAHFVDLDKYSGEIYSGSPVIYVGIPVPEENKQPENENKPENEENGSSRVQLNSKEEDHGKTPGFDFIPALIGILVVIFIRTKKNPE